MTTINVFPDSGHHYTFVPIAKEVLVKYPQFKTLCDQAKSDWRPLNHTWIRGRFATHQGMPGMWIAIESNTGTIKRGSIYEPRHQVPNGSTDNPSPYAVTDVTRLPADDHIVSIKVPGPDKNVVEVASFQVVWKRPNSSDPIDVDLIIDFGNTRTVVLALEDVASQGGKLSSVCRPIRFTKQGFDYATYTGKNKADDTCAIVDSWFVLHEPVFANLEPPALGFKPATEYEDIEQRKSGGLMRREKVDTLTMATHRVPQMFVELSPVVMGDSAREILANIALGQGGNYSLSSPKRYAWDHDPVGREGLEHWTMVLNRWNPKSRSQSELPKLAGSMLRFLPLDGRDWSIDEPPNEQEDHRRPSPNPENPSYPRSDAMSWAALSIIELAYRQITSEEWRRDNREFVPRRLRNILVTFPSGWSKGETEAYKQKWQKAVDTFTLSRLRDNRTVAEGGDRPMLVVDLDEAVASQLPFVYSEIRRMGDVGENWIGLYGRGGSGSNARLRIMTIDIGGGTTDISIVQYRDCHEGGGVDLEAELLFRDSSSIAGDTLVKEIIECVFLPAIGARFQADGDQATAFENVFRMAHDREGSKARWARITKLVFLPIVRQWLKDLGHDIYGNSETGQGWSPDRIFGAEGRLVDVGALDELNRFCRDSALGQDVLNDSEPINYQPADLAACISRTFAPVIQSLGKHVSAFDVDLVTLSGKPSELPQVRALLEELLPILPHRIIQAKDFPAGDWYPMTSDNRINDAKSVTAVGAALYQAVKNGKIPGWKIRRKGWQVPKNYWGSMPSRVQPNKFSKVFLTPDEDEATVPVQIGSGIGRQLLPSAAKPEQVYRFRWKDKLAASGSHFSEIFEVTLRRVPASEPNEIESLEITNIHGHVSGRDVTTADIELQLCTLEDQEFWLDTGRFDVVWPVHY
jgi:hypothetical protein